MARSKKSKIYKYSFKITLNRPLKLLNLCKIIETKLGRKKTPKNSPRVCDIDIIDFEGLVTNDKLTFHIQNA